MTSFSEAVDANRARALFEQIGVLYTAVTPKMGHGWEGSEVEYGEPTDVEELTGFLDAVKRAVVHRSEGRAMLVAIARYEALRDPGGS